MANSTLGGRYSVQDKIGTGGMAVVYRGIDDVLGRMVAIKTMLPQYASDESFAARFKQEAQAAAALQSPYIVNVYDWGKDGDTYYIIMEYLRGTDLKSGIRKHGALDCRKVAQIGSQIAQALSVAHRHDIIHRDIKPQNIMVQPDGNVKVMDFGIARAKNSHLTTDNSVLGTAHYVSPEQTQGKELDVTTDIYSLGIVMYEAATGRVPFDGEDAISVALKQVNEAPMPPSQVNPEVDPALESIILKCMQKQPADRFQTADELYRVLRDYLSGRMQAVLDVTSVAPQAVETSRLNRAGIPAVTGRAGMGGTDGGREAGKETSGHFKRSATQEEINRRHKRNVVTGVVVTVAVLAVLGALAFFFLGRPNTRQVPNLMGLKKEDAVSQIESSNYFKVGTVKEEFSDKVATGKVIDQDPDPSDTARQGTAIDLVISKGEKPATAVTVPDLKGKTPEEAEVELSKVGLKGKAGDSVFSDDVENGRVAAQDPASGATAKAGDTITYQLSKGRETVTIPYVVGMSKAEAVSKLEEAGFTAIVGNAESNEYGAGIVCAQNPTGEAAKGSEVQITVSTGSSKGDVPYVVGMGSDSAAYALSNAGFSHAFQYVADGSPAGTVVWQSVTGTADHGTTVTLGISTGTGGGYVPDGGDYSGDEGTGEGGEGTTDGGEGGSSESGEGGSSESGEGGSSEGGSGGSESGGESGSGGSESGGESGSGGSESGGESGSGGSESGSGGGE